MAVLPDLAVGKIRASRGRLAVAIDDRCSGGNPKQDRSSTTKINLLQGVVARSIAARPKEGAQFRQRACLCRNNGVG